MRSMTAYGYAESKFGRGSIEVELKCYNSRFFEVNHNISYALSSYELYIDNEIRKIVKRGHVDLSVRLKLSDSQMSVSVDQGLVEEYRKAFDLLKDMTGLDADLSDYLERDGVIILSKDDDSSIYKEPLDDALLKALEMVDESKSREGRATYEDLKRHADIFSTKLSLIEGYSKDLEKRFRQMFSDRLNELEMDSSITEDRLNQEIALMIVKYTINEEIKRLHAHLAEYYNLLESSDSVGKRLDFLAQEMNRETNTIASKSTLSEISSLTIAMKDAVENIREQVRNIE